MSKILNSTLKEFSFESKGKNLQGAIFAPEDKLEQPIDFVIVHGYGDHFMRYHQLIESLVQKGNSVAGPDLTGFGRSEGKQGHIDEFQTFITNLSDFLSHENIAEKITKDTKFIGFSMGGSVLAQYVFQSFIQNEIFLISPMLKLHIPAHENLYKIIDSVESIAPDLTIYSGIIPPTKLYKDELVHGNLSTSLARAILDNQGEEIIRQVAEIDNKVTIVHAKQDPVCDFKGSQLFVGLNKNAKLIEIEGIHHELLEIMPQRILEILTEE